MAERPFQPVPNTPLVADPTGDAIWKRWLQGLQRFLGDAVRGPGSSTDNAVARWNGTSGQFLNNSGVLIDDSNNVTGVVALTASGTLTMSGTAANIALGSNFISNGGTDAGLSFDGSNNATFSGSITSSALTSGRLLLSGASGLITGSGTFTYSDSATFTEILSSRSSSIEITNTVLNTHATGSSVTYLATDGAGDTYIRYAADLSGAAPSWSSGIDTSLDYYVISNTFNLSNTANHLFTINRSGVQTNTNKIYPGTDAAAAQSAAGIYAGTGAPNNANGNDGDFYFRGDGTVAGSNIVYHKEAGAWVALTGGGGGASGTTVEVDLGTPKFTGKFTITDAAIGATSKVQCWQAPGPYTGKGTLADEAMIQPVQVIAVAPATGSAVVYWQTPPYVAMSQQLSNGKFGAAGATFDRLMNQRTPAVFTPTRIGKVRGNVKFTYTILT